jgi:GLPGLI family protein
MKKLILPLFLLASITIASQETRTADLFLSYQVLQNGELKEGNLFKTGTQSIFYYENKKASSSSEKQEVIDGETVYKANMVDRSMFSSEKLYKNGTYSQYVVSEKMNDILWKLSAEEKKIGNYLCKKATATYKGRNYTAWYTLQVPLLFGPWKLHGLPGMIVEAYDAENFISFKLVTVKIKKQRLVYVSLDRNSAIDCKDLFLMKSNQANEIKKKIQTKLPRGASFQITKVENNWLEKSCN